MHGRFCDIIMQLFDGVVEVGPVIWDKWMLSRKAWNVGLRRISTVSGHPHTTGSTLEMDVSFL